MPKKHLETNTGIPEWNAFCMCVGERAACMHVCMMGYVVQVLHIAPISTTWHWYRKIFNLVVYTRFVDTAVPSQVGCLAGAVSSVLAQLAMLVNEKKCLCCFWLTWVWGVSKTARFREQGQQIIGWRGLQKALRRVLLTHVPFRHNMLAGSRCNKTRTLARILRCDLWNIKVLYYWDRNTLQKYRCSIVFSRCV